MAVEISDADHELLKLAKDTLGNSKTRLNALRVFKEAKPDMVLPELETDERITAALAPIQEENKKLREQIESDKTVLALEKKREALRLKGVDVAAVEKLMVERGITSHETAAEFLAANSKPAAPATPSWDRSAKVPSNDGLKKDPAAWAREEAAKVIAEIHAIK